MGNAGVPSGTNSLVWQLTCYSYQTKMSNVTRLHIALGAVATLSSLLLLSGCSSNDNSYTTATTNVSPPRRQVITVVEVQPPPEATDTESRPTDDRPGVELTKPLLTLNVPDAKTIRTGEVLTIDFSLANAKLRGDGGEYRIRYFVDDDEPAWIDNLKPIGLSGWLPGKHTIRLELIGPDGWPYRNGDQNIITREIIVTAQ
jgi:hypothetical protein